MSDPVSGIGIGHPGVGFPIGFIMLLIAVGGFLIEGVVQLVSTVKARNQKENPLR